MILCAQKSFRYWWWSWDHGTCLLEPYNLANYLGREMDSCIAKRRQNDKHQHVTEDYRKQGKGKFTATSVEGRSRIWLGLEGQKGCFTWRVGNDKHSRQSGILHISWTVESFSTETGRKVFVKVECSTFRDTFIMFSLLRKVSWLLLEINLDISALFRVVVGGHCCQYCVLG